MKDEPHPQCSKLSSSKRREKSGQRARWAVPCRGGGAFWVTDVRSKTLTAREGSSTREGRQGPPRASGPTLCLSEISDSVPLESLVSRTSTVSELDSARLVPGKPNEWASLQQAPPQLSKRNTVQPSTPESPTFVLDGGASFTSTSQDPADCGSSDAAPIPASCYSCRLCGHPCEDRQLAIDHYEHSHLAVVVFPTNCHLCHKPCANALDLRTHWASPCCARRCHRQAQQSFLAAAITEERVLTCLICQAQVLGRAEATAHFESCHLPNCHWPSHCHICSNQANSIAQLRQHWSSGHCERRRQVSERRQQPPAQHTQSSRPAEAQALPCPVCRSSALLVPELRAHFLEQHIPERGPVSCPVCNRRLNSTKQLQHHWTNSKCNPRQVAVPTGDSEAANAGAGSNSLAEVEAGISDHSTASPLAPVKSSATEATNVAEHLDGFQSALARPEGGKATGSKEPVATAEAEDERMVPAGSIVAGEGAAFAANHGGTAAAMVAVAPMSAFEESASVAAPLATVTDGDGQVPVVPGGSGGVLTGDAGSEAAACISATADEESVQPDLRQCDSAAVMEVAGSKGLPVAVIVVGELVAAVATAVG